jgi:hypothetical protein
MSKWKKLVTYSKKTFGLSTFLSYFDQLRRYKQINDSSTLFSILMGLMTGLSSMNAISQGTPAKYSRSVLEDFLKIDGLPRTIRRYVYSLIRKMKRGKMINLANVKGKIIASVDGVETNRRQYSFDEFLAEIAAERLDQHCQIAIHKDSKTGEIMGIDVYHRLVVICIITDRGPMPFSWAYQESHASEQFRLWLDAGGNVDRLPNTDADSFERLKQEGEITTLIKLLNDLASDFSRRMPFDVLIGDGLYDKATVITEVERYGIDLVAVQKSEKRKLRQDAAEDFSTQKPSVLWFKDQKEYEGWQKVYEDANINRSDQKVKIIRIIRRTKSGSVDNYFYCSNRNYITPRFVEWCRYYRWKEENGFNAWTNKWNLLKHVFHHSYAASDAMIGLIFISIILVENFRRGNLKRRHHHQSSCQALSLFFRQLVQGMQIFTRKAFTNDLANHLAGDST